MLYLALSLALLNSLGKERIFGGKDATAAPSIVALVYSDSDFVFPGSDTVFVNFFCAGSIINESWVLTAASCVHWMEPTYLYIIAGIIDLHDTSGGQKRDIKKIKLHARYNSHPPNLADQTLNDIALLELQSALELNNDVAVIDLANEGDPEEVGQEYTIQGWGEILPGDLPNSLQELDGLAHYKNRRCRKVLPDYTVSRKKHICAHAKPLDGSCHYDEGGPLWMMVNSRPLLYGIIIPLPAGCGSILPMVHTKVSFYRRWIERKSKLILSNPCTCDEQDSCECYSVRRLTDPDFDIEE